MTIIVLYTFIALKLCFFYRGCSRLTIMIGEMSTYNHDCTFYCLLKKDFLLLITFKAVYIYWGKYLCFTIYHPCFHHLRPISYYTWCGCTSSFYKGTLLRFFILIRDIQMYLCPLGDILICVKFKNTHIQLWIYRDILSTCSPCQNNVHSELSVVWNHNKNMLF
jgi:hypothetical protein